VLRLENSTTELNQLKALLLSDELEQLKELESKLKSLDFDAQDDETIMQRVTPLFDTILLERLQHKDEKTLKTLSKYLAQIITETSKNDVSGLSKSLQSVISPAISKEIADNKDVMIDALYPIMGGMISKYVTQAIKEMMENINAKIEDGLSFDKYKRKLKSKVSGVSESELLLEESSDALISSLFVLQKESGLLIAEAHLEDQEIDDPHMVASMASAIKDFINDWIKSHKTQSEVQMLSYGNATLYIESAGSVYVIAFLDAEPDYEQRTQINTFFASVVKKYADFFQNFEGDDSVEEVQTLSQKMSEYLNTQKVDSKTEKNSKNPVKYFLYLMAFVLVGYLFYIFNAWYLKYSVERRVYERTGQTVHLSDKDGQIVVDGHVDSMQNFYEVEKIIQRTAPKKTLQNNLLLPMSNIDKIVTEQMSKNTSTSDSLENKLTLLENSFEQTTNNLNKKILALKTELTQSEDHLKEILRDTTGELERLKKEKRNIKKILEIKKEINTKLDKTFVGNKFYNKKTNALDFSKLNLFPEGDANYDAKAIRIVSQNFDKYMQILVGYKAYIKNITIEGHTDSSGIEDDNLLLSKSRALVVSYFIKRLSIVKQYYMKEYIQTKSFGSKNRVMLNGMEDKIASRRIEINFELEKSKILDKLKEMTDD